MNGNSNGHGIGRSGQVHIKTPLLYSAPLSKHCSSFSSAGSSRPISVYLKLDNLQPSGSFKIRGLGYTIAKRARAEKGLHVITSSGGNAGLAAAHAANVLHLPCDVFVPSSCEAEVQALMRAEGATVTVVGNAWDDCDVAAKALSEELSSKGTPTCYVHPFEGEDLIEGHSSLGKEIYAQLREEAGIERGPDAVICSVGGGGLLRGLLRGMQTTRQERAQEKGLATPLMVTTQCHGANSFSQSLAASISEKGKPKLVTLDAITSQATSMGAKTCSRSAVEDALAYRTAAEGKLATVVMPDDLARAAAWRYARDHRQIVELACSAALAPLYFPDKVLRSHLVSRMGESRDEQEPLVIVVVVCGGNKSSAALMERYRLNEESMPNLVDEQKILLDGALVQ